MAVGVLIGAQVASSLLGFGASRKAKKARRRANAIERKRKAIANVQARRQALAAVRRQQAAQAAQAIVAGTGGTGGELSSARAGTASSLNAQTAANIASQRQQEALGGQFNAEIGRSQSADSAAQGFGVAASVFGTLAGSAQAKAAAAAGQVAPITQDDILSFDKAGQ